MNKTVISIILILLIVINLVFLLYLAFFQKDCSQVSIIENEVNAKYFGETILKIKFPDFNSSGYTLEASFNKKTNVWTVSYGLQPIDGTIFLGGGGPLVIFKTNCEIVGFGLQK
ncbi:MAG: hypothetical protein A2Y15_03635 [Clostridiales bacterium GWF2_36_10]|nr:MAG: hypothetical protein A2Y15_03635 [Clostridiales bacterium GWF2_36_10]HAN21687.1 hypothetical protein [Clostridiales bacterium]